MLSSSQRIAIALLLLAPGSVLAKPPVLEVPVGEPPAALIGTIKANLARCFNRGGVVWMEAPATNTMPLRLVINGSLGHAFTVLSFEPASVGSNVKIELIYALGRKRRGEEWRQALATWTSNPPGDYCPRMP